MEYNIPLEIQKLLDNYVELLISEFGDAVFGVYIYGSLVTGYFDLESSNVDFMTILKKELSEDDLKRIQSVHNKLEGLSAYSFMLEGEYVNLNDINNGMPDKKYPYFAFGKFQGYMDIKYFTWFQLSERGISYYGTDFSDIAADLNWEDVRNELINHLNEYLPNLINWKLLVSDIRLALVVLTVCRIYYTLENKSTISKDGSGEYALSKLGEEWHPLINEALRIQKKSSKKSLFKSKIKRLNKTREFLDSIYDICIAN